MNKKDTTIRCIHFAVLALACLLVYSNNFNHEYNLDDEQLIKNNHYVRSLKFIPQYFTSANTYSSVHLGGYRPVVQTTYAINYFISGYKTWSWHLFQIMLHIVCVLCVYLLALKFFPSASLLGPPLIFSLIFALNPVNAGVINYFSARSSLLAAALILPAILLYAGYRQTNAKYQYGLSLLLFLLALFSKEEAVAGVVVFFLYEVWLTSKSGARGYIADIYRTITDFKTIKKLSPYFMACVLFVSAKFVVEGKYFELGRRMYAPQDMSPWTYFITQVTAWWHYVIAWLVPVNLIADNQVYPVHHSLFEPEVLLALAGWILVGLVLKLYYKRRSGLTFLAVSALALISPSSSFIGLGEMVNELRPYLPATLFSLMYIVPLLMWIEEQIKDRRPLKFIWYLGLIVILAVLCAMTCKRNIVFKTCDNYTLDIIRKAPASPRSYNNYANVLMGRAQYDEAIKYLNKSIQYAPYWIVPHLNLAITYTALKDNEKAKYYFDRAVELDRFSAVALFRRGEFYINSKQYAAALKDYKKATELIADKYGCYKGMATAYSGLGDWENSVKYSKLCAVIDYKQAEIDGLPISIPYWEDRKLYQAGINYYTEMLNIFPNREWLYVNIGNLSLRLGNKQAAEENFELAKKYKK